MAVTINDIARICNVSRTTVIRALNDTGRISASTKKHIKQVARENGYRPDLLARGLAKSRTFTIGVVVLNVMNQHFAQILNSVEAAARKKDYGVNIMLHGQDPVLERSQVQRLLDYHVDGIILSSVNQGEEYADILRQAPVPIVTLDNKIAADIPFVGVDNRSAVCMLTEKAIRKGYQRVVFLCPPLAQNGLNLYVHQERCAGFLQAAEAAGFRDAEVISEENYFAKCSSRLLPDRGTAYICSGDIFALDLMKYFRKQGKKAGNDYGLAGFDGTDILDYVVPKIDTVDNREKLIAENAVNILLALIDKQEVSTEIVLETEYINGDTL